MFVEFLNDLSILCLPQVLNFKSRLQEQNTKFAALETKLNALEECTAPAVAFTATLSVSSAYSELKVSAGHKVIYNNIIENINGDYNDTTGEFTASEAGIYDFNVHGMSQTDQQVFLDLDKYSGDIEETITGLFGGLYGQAGSGQGHEAGSTSATIHLNVGDRVYVKANWGSVMFAGDGWHTNSFSGELISSDKCRH